MITSSAVPLFILVILTASLIKKVNSFGAFRKGASEGLKSAVSVFPALLAIITAIELMNVSGLTDALTAICKPVFSFVNVPPEISPLVILRPISGSGSTAALQSILNKYSPDSYIGHCASVIAGGTETTFYTLAVYFAATKVKHTRHTIPCALLSDLICVIFGCFISKIIF